MDVLAADLPPLYAPWITALLGEPPPAERHATCASCALCGGGGLGERPVGRVRAHPQVKCCTYRPALPNFLVGAILADPTASSGRRTLAARMAAEPDQVSPLGVGRAMLEPPPVGSGPEHACPHLDQGLCSIWAHRHATCATWWCKHERGAAGQAAWHALRAFLLATEDALALWCCAELGFQGADLLRLVAATGQRPELRLAPNTPLSALWGAHGGDIEGFYLRAHERVAGLTLEQVLSVGGSMLRALAAAAREAWAALDLPTPAHLGVGAHRVVGLGVDGALVETYSPTDPILVPALMQSVLHLFDGRPVDQVLATLDQDYGLALDPGLLRQLVDHQVLVAAAGPPEVA